MVWKDLTVEELRVNMTRAAMAEAYSGILKDPKQTQDWLVERATNLLPK